MANRYPRQEWQSGLIASPFGPVSGERMDHIEDWITIIFDDYDAHAASSGDPHPQYLQEPVSPVVNGPVYWNGAGWTSAKLTTSQISATAGILKSQLAALALVNADIDPAAAIAKSKLALAASITDADIAPGAAIAKSKLNLAGQIGTAELAAGLGFVPPAVVVFTASPNIPAGWARPDGSSQLRAGGTYDALFAEIGVQYGAVDGSHFNLPDLPGRVIVVKGTHVDVDTLGDSDGLAVGARRVKHGHTHALTLPDHIHSGGGTNTAGFNSSGTNAVSGNTGNPTTHPAINGSIGPDTNEGPAYIALNALIKL